MDVAPCDAQLIFYPTLASTYALFYFYSIPLLMQPTRIGRSIRNLRGHLSNSATRLCFYSYLVARFLPSYYLYYFLLWVLLYRSVLVLSPAHF